MRFIMILAVFVTALALQVFPAQGARVINPYVPIYEGIEYATGPDVRGLLVSNGTLVSPPDYAYPFNSQLSFTINNFPNLTFGNKKSASNALFIIDYNGRSQTVYCDQWKHCAFMLDHTRRL